MKDKADPAIITRNVIRLLQLKNEGSQITPAEAQNFASSHSFQELASEEYLCAICGKKILKNQAVIHMPEPTQEEIFRLHPGICLEKFQGILEEVYGSS